MRKRRFYLTDSERLGGNGKLASPELLTNVDLYTSFYGKVPPKLPLLPENWCSTPGVLSLYVMLLLSVLFELVFFVSQGYTTLLTKYIKRDIGKFKVV